MKDLLTSEDYQFGKDIIRQYSKLSLNDIYALMYEIRRQLASAEYGRKEFKTGSQKELSEFKEKLSKGTIIHNIVINTNKGPLTIYNYGNIYHNLILTAKRLIPKYEADSKKFDKSYNLLSVDNPFTSIIMAINKTPLGPDQRRIVIGMLLAYFQIFGKGKPMTEAEHKVSSDLYTWKRYLSGFVKQKLEHFNPIY
jgi:hypothetical protein